MVDSHLLLRAAETLLADYLQLRRGERLLVTADTRTDPRVTDILLTVAERIGARAMVSLSLPLPYQGKLADPYVTEVQLAAMKACDAWVDLAFPYFAGSHAHDEVMKEKRVRYLLG